MIPATNSEPLIRRGSIGLRIGGRYHRRRIEGAAHLRTSIPCLQHRKGFALRQIDRVGGAQEREGVTASRREFAGPITELREGLRFIEYAPVINSISQRLRYRGDVI